MRGQEDFLRTGLPNTIESHFLRGAIINTACFPLKSAECTQPCACSPLEGGQMPGLRADSSVQGEAMPCACKGTTHTVR